MRWVTNSSTQIVACEKERRMEAQKQQMKVEVLRSTTIPHINPHIKPSEIPLSIFDRYAYDFHTAYLFAFTPPTATNAAIIEGLSKTLPHFPTLTARLGLNTRRLPSVMLGSEGEGALVVEASVASKLADHLPLEPSRDFWLLHPPLEGPVHLLQVQLNRFECGGLVLGVTVHHRLADGQSMSNFLVAWARTVRGLATDPLPIYDRPWLEPRKPPKCEFQHWEQEFVTIPSLRDQFSPNPIPKIDVEVDKISNVLLHYSSEYITALKTRMPGKYTTFETLAGYLWRKITVARGLTDGQQMVAAFSVNGRPRLQPPVPKEFFGNLVIPGYAQATAKELIEGGVAGAARIIREASRMMGNDYFKSMIDFGAMYENEELVPIYELFGNFMSPNLDIASWLGFQFEEIDFGGGGALCAVMPTWMPAEGIVVLLPSVRRDGGINVVATLLEEHSTVLKQISHSIE